MKKLTLTFTLALAVCLVFFAGKSRGQLSIGVQPATGFAATVGGCPVASSGFILCTVVPTGGQPFLALSVAGYNGGVPFSLQASGGPTYTGTAPIVVTGPVISCPTCAQTGAVVTGFGTPARTGNVVLTKADITQTGIAASSSTTASTTTTLQ